VRCREGLCIVVRSIAGVTVVALVRESTELTTVLKEPLAVAARRLLGARTLVSGSLTRATSNTDDGTSEVTAGNVTSLDTIDASGPLRRSVPLTSLRRGNTDTRSNVSELIKLPLGVDHSLVVSMLLTSAEHLEVLKCNASRVESLGCLSSLVSSTSSETAVTTREGSNGSLACASASNANVERVDTSLERGLEGDPRRACTLTSSLNRVDVLLDARRNTRDETVHSVNRDLLTHSALNSAVDLLRESISSSHLGLDERDKLVTLNESSSSTVDGGLDGLNSRSTGLQLLELLAEAAILLEVTLSSALEVLDGLRTELLPLLDLGVELASAVVALVAAATCNSSIAKCVAATLNTTSNVLLETSQRSTAAGLDVVLMSSAGELAVGEDVVSELESELAEGGTVPHGGLGHELTK